MRWRPTAPAYFTLRGLQQPCAAWAACRPLLLLQTAVLQRESHRDAVQQPQTVKTVGAVAERATAGRTADSEPATVEVLDSQSPWFAASVADAATGWMAGSFLMTFVGLWRTHEHICLVAADVVPVLCSRRCS